jgi:hypothetical protein
MRAPGENHVIAVYCFGLAPEKSIQNLLYLSNDVHKPADLSFKGIESA